MPQPAMTPLQREAMLDSNGQPVKRWYFYFTSLTQWVADFITNCVRGRPNLQTIGRLVKVSDVGEIGESDFSTTDVVLGASSLTHAGRLPKVSATAGTLAESSLTDDGTKVSGTEPLALDTGVASGTSQVALKAATLGALDLYSITAGTQILLMDAAWSGGTETARDASCYRMIKVANQILFQVATGQVVGNAVTLWTTVLCLNTANGRVGFGGNAAPAQAMDGTGDLNVSGAYRVGNVQGGTHVLPLAKLTPAGANGSLTLVGGIATAWTDPT